jgi:hypothetical protein
MAQKVARSIAGISLPVAVVMIAIGCGNTRSAPLTTTEPTPPPALGNYQLAGIVTDDNDLPVADAPLTFYSNNSANKSVRTDARGHYSIAIYGWDSSFDGNVGVAGALVYAGGGDYEAHVKAVPPGPADVVIILRIRHVRNINAGQSTALAIDTDSSVAYDREDWLRMDGVWEKFHVRVAQAGTLRIVASSGGIVPGIAVLCVYPADNCESEFVTAPPGTAARRVKANSQFEIRLAIPAQMAPQRYEVATSLE